MKIKNNRLTLITLKKECLNYLSKFGKRVPTEHKQSNKRPYTGILINDENMEYVIPLTSPKEKHKQMRNGIDFHKIDEGRLGAVNLNNILPVNEYCYEIINTNDIACASMDLQYATLLKSQITWLNTEKKGTLYLNVKARCCNFPLLEIRCSEWLNEASI